MGVVTIGVDIGTTGVKAVALDTTHGPLAHRSRSSRLFSPAPGWAEASTEEWRDLVHAVLRDLVADAAVDAAAVRAVATTGMVPAVVPMDDSGVVLRRAMLQNDARAGREVAELAAELGQDEMLRATGSPITQQSVGPTARWLQRHEPDVWARTTLLMGSYDWALTLLGAQPHVERNWALESGLFTVQGAEYSPAVERTLTAGLVPPVRRSGDVVGELSAAAAAATGLLPGTALVVGGADHVLSAFGAGLFEEGEWLVKLGGAGDILVVSSAPVVDSRFYLDEHPAPGLWLPNGCMAASGSLVRWVQQLLGEPVLTSLDAEAARRSPAEVLCLPYFLGEKAPLHDPDLRGSFTGLHLGHDRHDLYRAALEGVAFGFRHNAEVMRERGLDLSSATVTNGGSTSHLWKEIHASVLGVPLRTVRRHQGASLGAAVAAAIGVGALDSWSDVERFVEPGDPVDPVPEWAARYDEAYHLWRELAEVTATTARALARR